VSIIKILLYLVILFLLFVIAISLISRFKYASITTERDVQKYAYELDRNSSNMFLEYYYYHNILDRKLKDNNRTRTVDFLLKYQHLNNDIVCFELRGVGLNISKNSYRYQERLQAIKNCRKLEVVDESADKQFET
jgi:hypothetical protein